MAALLQPLFRIPFFTSMKTIPTMIRLFYIHLKAKNNEGLLIQRQRSVSLFPRVVAGFNFSSPDQGCNPLEVSFSNNSKGKNLNYIWDFGDKTYSS